MGDTLAPIETCCACYTLRCQPRTDLSSHEGTLPPHCLYVGSTHSLNHRIRQHQTGIGSRFTRTHPVLEENGVEAVNLDYRATSEQVLRYENNRTIELMYKFMEQYSHPRPLCAAQWPGAVAQPHVLANCLPRPPRTI